MNVVKVLGREVREERESEYETAIDMSHYYEKESTILFKVDGVPYSFKRNFSETTYDYYEEDEENGRYGPGTIEDEDKGSTSVKHELVPMRRGLAGDLVPELGEELSISEPQGERLFELLSEVPEGKVVTLPIPSGINIQMLPRRMEDKIRKRVHDAFHGPSS